MGADMIEKIFDQGPLFAIIIFVAYLTSRISWWGVRRLLDPATDTSEGGLLVQYFTTHREFLAGLEKRDVAQSRMAKSHATLLGSLSERIEQEAARTTVLTEDVNQSAIDLAKAKFLEISIKPDMSVDEVEGIKKKIEDILLMVEARHEKALS